MTDWAPGPALAAYHAGVMVIGELAAQFTDEAWAGPTTCAEWRAADLAGHLRCVADDYHEYLDDAPVSRMSRLMARSASPESLARKLARQNTAELAALADATGPEHIAAFGVSARAYAGRVLPVWDLPHHRYRDTVVTVGGMVGAASAEWHLHAWDLAAALGKDYAAGQPRGPGGRLAGGDAAPPAGRKRRRGPVRRGGGRRRACRPAPARLAGQHGGRRLAVPAAGLGPGATLSGMTFDVNAVRAAYPALADGYAYLDGAAGTQVPAVVIDAISAAHRSGLGNAGGEFPASKRSDAITAECRQAVADLVGGSAAGVILGPNMTTLTYRLAATLSRDWGPGDEVIVSRLDHDANVRPWVQAARRAAAVVRWAEVSLPSGELDAGQYDALLTERTRLVAVTAASNIIGTRPDVAAITAKARAAGALSYVDGVHATPHGPADMTALGADFYATSAYKWSGPHIGAVVADPSLLETLRPDKLVPSPDTVPERFEQGTASLRRPRRGHRGGGAPGRPRPRGHGNQAGAPGGLDDRCRGARTAAVRRHAGRAGRDARRHPLR